MSFNLLPRGTPAWLIWLLNLAMLGFVAALVLAHRYLTWRFTLGAVFGILLMQICHRVAYGRWISWETNDPPT